MDRVISQPSSTTSDPSFVIRPSGEGDWLWRVYEGDTVVAYGQAITYAITCALVQGHLERLQSQPTVERSRICELS